MDVDLKPAGEEEKPVLSRLLQLYLHDFSEFGGGDLDETGRYRYGYFDAYWTDEDHHPFLIRVDGRLAGFALARLGSDVSESGHVMSVAEFFVVRKYRGLGVGTRAVTALWDRFDLEWEVLVLRRHASARGRVA